jgi:hypothetical protein
MAWYQTGTVSGASGQKIVSGAGGAAFNGNVQPGDAFRITATDWSSEIVTVDSNTQITLRDNLPSTLSASGYSIWPTVARDVALTEAVQDLVDEFQTVVDEAGVGMFAIGTVGAPSVRCTTDQNTGVNFLGSGTVQIVSDGNAVVNVETSRRVGINVASPTTGIDLNSLAYPWFNMRCTGSSAAYGQFRNHSDTVIGLIGAAGGSALGAGANTNFVVRAEDKLIFSIGNTAQSNVTATGTAINGGVTAAAAMLDVFTDSNAVGYAPLQVRGGPGGYGAGLKAASPLATSGALKEMGKLVWDGEAAWDSADTASQDAMARIYVVLNGATYEGLRLTSGGSLVVGVAATLTYHSLRKDVTEGSPILEIAKDGTNGTAVFSSVANDSWNGAASAMHLGKDSSTSRSLTAAGTGNWSGADIAETKRKALLCGTILKGRVCGMDAAGDLVTTWVDAVQFRIKATDPALVMGDRWGTPQALGLPRPGERPAFQTPERTSPPAYTGRAKPVEGADPLYSLTIVAWAGEQSAHQAALAAHAAAQTALWADAKADHAEAVAAYEAAKATWDAAYETARQQIDRIAYCGTVPLVIDGVVEAGHYVIAQPDGEGGIKAVCVPNYEDDARRLVIGRVEVANPSEARWRALIDPALPLDPAWTAIIDVMRL